MSIVDLIIVLVVVGVLGGAPAWAGGEITGEATVDTEGEPMLNVHGWCELPHNFELNGFADFYTSSFDHVTAEAQLVYPLSEHWGLAAEARHHENAPQETTLGMGLVVRKRWE